MESFSIAYTERESGMFIMHTFTPKGRSKTICLRAERDRRERKCTGFEHVEESFHWMENVEGWEPTTSNLVAGIRRIDFHQDTESSDDYPYNQRKKIASLRHRRKKGKQPTVDDGEDDEWEAWTMSFDGVVTRYSLTDTTGDSSDKGLLVSRTGPFTRLGQRSIAVGFGNTVKVLLVGTERYDDEDDYDEDIAAASYRKRNRR